jgi:glycosyltransferase involved in cell wall biosynthesis
LEAASYGKPTVCFNIPNLEEIMHQQIGLTAPAFDTRAFAAKVTELANNDTLRHNYGKKAHDWANKHLWNEIVNQQEDFYYSCIKQ